MADDRPTHQHGRENGSAQTEPDAGPPDRDKLIAAIYDAATDANAYGRFVAELSGYLEHRAAKAWNISDLSEVDIGVVESDRGLAMHLENLNRRFSETPGRVVPGSLRDRMVGRPGLAVLIDRNGRVVGASQATRAEFGGEFPDPEGIADRLHASDARRLREAITDHTVRDRYVAPRILCGDAFHLIVRTQHCETDREDFLCLETLDVDWSVRLEAVLRASFGLTPAELKVLRKLVAGAQVKAIALDFGRSEGTVRNQTKSVLAKTGAGGIANLNRIVALIAENLAGAPSPAALADGLDPGLDILTLPDGRALEVRQQGPRDGRPVLYIHGMLFGTELPAMAVECLYRHSLRLIAPARPNFGMSDPSPGTPDGEPDRLVEDLLFVLDHYGIERTVCLTNIAGAVYAYTLAAAAPGRISGMVHAASILPVLKAKQFASMSPTQRLIGFLMRFAPAYLPPLMQSGLAQIRASGELAFLSTLYGEGTCDHAVVQRPDLVELMRRSVHFGTDQGYLGAFTDTVQLVQDWSDKVERISAAGIPSVHIHGRLDPATMFDDAVAFVERFDTLRLQAVEGAGQLVLFDRPEVVIDAVAAMLGQG